MLTEQQLKMAAKNHFDAEEARDIDWIARTVTEDVYYLVASPWYPDDPAAAESRISGRQAVCDLWEGYFERFNEIQLSAPLEKMIAFPDKNLVFCHLDIRATPIDDFEGFPGGKPWCSEVAALCVFNDDSVMISETVYGDVGKVMLGLGRMREFLQEGEAVAAN